MRLAPFGGVEQAGDTQNSRTEILRSTKGQLVDQANWSAGCAENSRKARRTDIWPNLLADHQYEVALDGLRGRFSEFPSPLHICACNNVASLIAVEDILEIFCDEAGNTGPALLDPAQRYFAFSSVAVSNDDARAIIQDGLKRYPVQMSELKAAKLMRSHHGRSLIATLVEAVNGRFAVTIHDKLLSLCSWFFEYIYEPVYKKSPWLLYEKNLGRFVAMIVWVWLQSNEKDARRATAQFQKYMRTLDEREASLLFDGIKNPLGTAGHDDPFEMILRFARGYRTEIIADNATLNAELPDNGRWVLDLSATSLWSHLNYWGRKKRPLSLMCDVSKPLQSIISKFTGDEGDPGIRRARAKGRQGPLGWKYASPPAFVDSRDHPAIQLADVIAGASIVALTQTSTGLKQVKSVLAEHALPQCILPDFTVVDPRRREAAVNAAILYRLAWRAENAVDPYTNLEQDYAYIEAQWDAGSYRLA